MNKTIKYNKVSGGRNSNNIVLFVMSRAVITFLPWFDTSAVSLRTRSKNQLQTEMALTNLLILALDSNA